MLHRRAGVLIVLLYLAGQVVSALVARAVTSDQLMAEQLVDVYVPVELSVIALVAIGVRFVPVVFVGELLMAALMLRVSPFGSPHVWSSAVLAVAVYAPAAVAVRRLVDPGLRRVRDLLLLIVLVGILATLVDALVSAWLAVAQGSIAWSQYLDAVGLLWSFTTAGVITLVPAAMLAIDRIVRGGWRPHLPTGARTRLEIGGQVFVVLLAAGLTLTMVTETGRRLSFVVSLPIVWIALRHGLPGAAASVLFLHNATILLPPLTGVTTPVEGTEVLLIFLGSIGLAIGGLVTERDTLDAARRVAEEQMHRTDQRLAAAQRMQSLGRLAGGIAHDINNLLTVVTGYAELLEARLASTDANGANEATEIRDAAARGKRLVEQLLAFSARRPMIAATVDLDDAMRAMQPTLELLLGSSIALELDLQVGDGDVPVDHVTLERAMINLALNSRDAMPQGGVVRIETRLERRTDPAVQRPGGPSPQEAVVRVIDSGCGIAASDLPSVLEPFYTTKGVGAGSGLGLATVYGIVTQAGGRIELRSVEGEGTTAEFALPFMARTSGPALEQRRPEATEPPEPARRTVLLVEDEATIRDLLTMMLRSRGYQVLVASDGFEALIIDDTHHADIDIVITDLRMPSLDGQQLVEQLRSRGRTVPVLFISGYADTGPPAMPLQGRERFLAKPFGPTELFVAIDELIETAAEGGRADEIPPEVHGSL